MEGLQLQEKVNVFQLFPYMQTLSIRFLASISES